MATEVNKLLKTERDILIKMYMPENRSGNIDGSLRIVVEKKWHKFWKPFLRGCSVWHTPFQSGRMVLDKEKHSGVKTLLTVHDLNFFHEGKPPEEQQKSLDHTQKLINKSDAIVCISEFTRNDVLKHCRVDNKPVYVIHNGCNTINTAQQKQPSLDIRHPFLFGLGYVNPKKNYKVLVPLLKFNPGLELVISGRLDDMRYIEEIKAYAAALGVEERLHITGPVSEEEKAWLLSNCLAFFQPSLAEGFGFPVIEAMSLGKPVFISNLTSLPEIGGDAAFYFTSFAPEAMQKVFIEGMERFTNKDMKPVVIQQSKKFNWEESASKYVEVYKSLF